MTWFLSHMKHLTLTDLNTQYRSADKSLAQPGRKQVRKHVMDTRGFNKM